MRKIDGWFKIKNANYGIKYMNKRTGLVVSIEKISENNYQVVTLPENFEDDNSVIDIVSEKVNEEKAQEKAKEFMENFN